MDQLIINRFNNSVLQEARRRYSIAKDQIRAIDTFENFIYEFERDSCAYILRIAHSFRRDEYLVQGEIDWIDYLAEGGVSVAKAIFSDDGNLVEAIDDQQGGTFLATAFMKAQGQAPWDLWTPKLYETYGQTIGQMHALSKQYQPQQPTLKRPDWDNDLFNYVERYLPESECIAKSNYGGLCHYVNTLDKDYASYGLIHQDAHGNNFFVDEAGQITLFDFDECAYSWFINEIAIALFYIVQDAEDWSAFTKEFMTHFLRGYVQACPLDQAWLQEIPHFLKLREIELYAVLFRDFDVKNIDDEWCARFMHGRKLRIEQGVPFIDFDFKPLSGLCHPGAIESSIS